MDLSLILGTAVRCRHGAPAVMLCAPLRRGRPFPTTFWLSCPHLARLCGALESRGAVPELQELLQDRRGAWTAYNMEHARLRLSLVSQERSKALRLTGPALWDALRRGGIGGVDYRSGGGAKCLHLHTASWLALGRHPGVEYLKKSVAPLECDAPARCIREGRNG